MKVAISVLDGSLEAEGNQSFGRHPYFEIVGAGTMAFEAIPNGMDKSMKEFSATPFPRYSEPTTTR